MRIGTPSKRWPHLGVWAHSYGPNSDLPGDRLRLVIYDKQDNIVRRFEQVAGKCIDEGYVDFFNSPRCRSAQYLYPLVDIAPDGTQTELIGNFTPNMDQGIYLALLGEWAHRYGVEQ